MAMAYVGSTCHGLLWAEAVSGARVKANVAYAYSLVIFCFSFAYILFYND